MTTAAAIEQHALRPALLAAGLPEGALALVHSKEHAAAHALFSERAVRLADNPAERAFLEGRLAELRS